MHILEAFRLGYKTLIYYKRRSLSSIIIIGVIFGVLFGILFLLQGLENTILDLSHQVSGGQYYATISTNLNQCDIDFINTPAGLPEFTYENCPNWDIVQDHSQLISQYHGTIISTDHAPVSPAAVSSFIQTDLSQTPDGTIPVLISFNTALSWLGLRAPNPLTNAQAAAIIRYLQAEVVGHAFQPNADSLQYFVAGLLPSGAVHGLDYGKPRRLTSNPLDLVLNLVGRDQGANLLILNYDNSAIQAYLSADHTTSAPDSTLLVQFSTYRDLEDFLGDFGCLTLQQEFCTAISSQGGESHSPDYFVSQSFTSQIYTRGMFNFIHGFINLASSLVILIAMVVLILTCVKILSMESQTIHLYRALGASTFDICLIYFAYLLELCLAAVIFAIILGLVIAGLISLFNLAAFSQMFTFAFTRNIPPRTVLIGFNWEITKIIGIILLGAPISLLVAFRQITSRR